MSQSWIGRAVLQTGADRKAIITGRVIVVNELDDLVIVASAPRVKPDGCVDNYVATPQFLSLANLRRRLVDDDAVQLVAFESPDYWLWTPEQLEGAIGDGTGRHHRRRIHSWKAKADQAFALIEPFVKDRSIEDIACDPARPRWPAARAIELHVPEARIRRALNMYLFGMGNKRALMPGYIRCGAPGKQKFSKVDTGRPDIAARLLGKKRHHPALCKWTRAKLAMGWKKHKKPGVSVATALLLCSKTSWLNQSSGTAKTA